MGIRRSIRFYLNDTLVELSDISPSLTLLDFLRLDRALKGTKEGCAEGDCGACTVLVGRLCRQRRLAYESINACIRFVASLDGTHVITIEHLSDENGGLHLVQQAMVENHASQCGFCTPGIVMSLYGLWLTTADLNAEVVERAMQGNLCRCTGYASIMRAAQSAAAHSRTDDRLMLQQEAMAAKLQQLQDDTCIVVEARDGRAILPATVEDLAGILMENPDATIVAGATDVGLWVTKSMRMLPTMVFMSRVADMQTVKETGLTLEIGASVTFSEAQSAILRHVPQLKDLWRRIGGLQVRNAGTIGGNIANGSPIGDTPPALIALGSSLTLRRGADRRIIRLEDFFIDYGRQDIQQGEFLESISVPLPSAADHYAVYKISKRFDEDISAVLGAFRLRLEDGIVRDATIVYGGMAGIPKRARTVESALVGKSWSRDTLDAAVAAYETDFRPLSDWRASAEYRMLAAKNLLLRFWCESTDARHFDLEDYQHG
jgi:xanthine dehydrogenase small subunit